jgi:hypothetical protein
MSNLSFHDFIELYSITLQYFNFIITQTTNPLNSKLKNGLKKKISDLLTFFSPRYNSLFLGGWEENI